MSHNPKPLSFYLKETIITASYTLDDNLVAYGNNTYLYDEDGYLSEKTTPIGTTTYSYGTMGELLSVTTPTKTITYKHNASNQRVAKLVDGVVVEKYLWANLTTLLAIHDANNTLMQRFEYIDQRMPISMTMGTDKYYLHYDQVGSLRAVTDDSHTIVKKVTYDTFGNVLSDTNQTLKLPFGFAGGLYDPDTKLTRFGYRDYDAYAGKWTAKDPIGFGGGDSNLYGYVLGDPVNFVDPEGLVAFLVPYIPAAANAVRNAYLAHRAYSALQQVGNGAYCAKPVKKNQMPNHPGFQPHKKKSGLIPIPWNKNKKGWPAKDGSYWTPVPDGHKGTHNPHWDQQFPSGRHKPQYP